ncbi:hypothetical protein B4Q04_00610 [Zobellia sp. OII3]|uniref:hypothetical protein n=1 Tax=Zobellia sp. OII3 TaxID=2034520 RepID=UPI000B52A0A2|nr:hypothetical protein [Zobellia sp. OII3]OWW26219.1 hypothetical protein B4Q04_00610 [Zobellia sp. OII3]
MERERSAWENALNELVAQTKACEHTYGTLIQSDRYPTWQTYFKKRHFEERDFDKILADEYYAVNENKVVPDIRTETPIFEPLEKQLLEKNLSDREVIVLITANEEALVLQYQNLLAFDKLPKTTSALLQSQAEDLNSTIQSLRMDYNTKYRTGPTETQPRTL